jgi:hypothetical protein
LAHVVSLRSTPDAWAEAHPTDHEKPRDDSCRASR